MSEAVCTLAVPEKCNAKAVIVYIGQEHGQVVQIALRCRTHRDDIALNLAKRIHPGIEWFASTLIKPVES